MTNDNTELTARIEAYRSTAGELKRLMSLRLAKSEALAAAKTQAETLRVGMGAALLVGVLAGNESDETATIDEAAKATTRAAALGQIVTALDIKIAEQQQAVRTANADCMRADGAALLAEADERKKRTDALLAPLVEWEGVNYAPVRPEKSPQVTAQAMVMASGKFPVVPFVGLNTRSITEAMRDKGNALIKYADLVEAGTPIPTSIYTGEKLATVPDYLQAVPIPALA